MGTFLSASFSYPSLDPYCLNNYIQSEPLRSRTPPPGDITARNGPPLQTNYPSGARTRMNDPASKAAYMGAQTSPSSRLSLRRDMLDRLRELSKQKKEEKTGSVSMESIVESLMAESSKKEKEKVSKPKVHYNFKELSTKIQRAKDSVSAGQAVIAAKRKVAEMKRKLAGGDGDSEEIELALNHAKQMERAANKKKRHLELEEMIASVGKRDENRDKTEKAVADMASAYSELFKEKLNEAEDGLMKEQTGIFIEVTEKLKERGEELTEEMVEELDAAIEDVTSEEKKILEELSEAIEGLEILDPHMDERELHKFKLKHRNSEDKELLKADMDYLKEYLKMVEDRGQEALKAYAGQGMGGSFGFSAEMTFAQPVNPEPMPCVDVLC